MSIWLRLKFGKLICAFKQSLKFLKSRNGGGSLSIYRKYFKQVKLLGGLKVSFFLAGICLMAACDSTSKSDSSGKPESKVGAEQPKSQIVSSEETGVVVSNAFMKLMAPGQTTAAVYLTVQNLSDQTTTLTYVHSPVAENIEVHRHIYEDGMMQMRHVKHLNINPDQKIQFKPGGYHLMLFGVYDTFNVGDTFNVSFEFSDQKSFIVPVEVRPIH